MMKRIIAGACFLLSFVLFLSCQSSSDKEKKEKEDPIAQLESMLNDVKENGKDWNANQWESFIRDVYDTELSFWESEPSKEDIKKYDKIDKKFGDVMNKLMREDEVEEAFRIAYEDLEEKFDFKKISKAEKKARKAAEKAERNNDDDDDDDEDY